MKDTTPGPKGETEELLRLIFDSSRDAIVLHTVEGQVIEVNEPWLRLEGISRAQALTLNIDQLGAEGSREEAQKARDLWARAVAGEPQLSIWPSRRFGNGTPFLAEVAIRGVTWRGEGAILAQIRDLSEQRQAEGAMREGEMRLQREHTLLQNLIDGSLTLIAAVDDQMRFIAFNRAFAEALQGVCGIPPRLGQPASEVLALKPEALVLIPPLWERALAGKTFRSTARLTDTEGGERTLDMRFSPIRTPGGELLGAAHVSTDITAQVERDLALERSKEAAEEANRAKSEFLGVMSHELRTPLTAVSGALDLLLESDPTDTQRSLLELARGGSEQLLNVIEDMLDFIRIEKGRLAVRPRPFSLPRCLRQVRDMFLIPARRKGLDLSLVIDSALPEQVVGDPDRLSQILVNLVSNALKFTERGRIELRASPGITDAVLLAVHDTGIGIAPPVLQRIFEPFTQADLSSTRRFGGTGLGLAISRELAHLMNGTLEVESDLGQGSTFTCRLSLPPAPVTEIREPPSPSGPAVRTGGGLLLVEDEPDIRRILQLQLVSNGWEVTEAADGAEALERWRPGLFDVILMDLQMPRIDGEEATRRIRDMEGQHQAPRSFIVALTAHAGAAVRRRCLAAGMDNYAAKPVRFSELLQTLNARRSSTGE